MESNLSTNTTLHNYGRNDVEKKDGHYVEHCKSVSIMKGIINSLDKQGINIDTSFTELIENSIDRKATNIRIISYI